MKLIVILSGTMYWLVIEVGLGLFACCLPTLRFLFHGMSPGSMIDSFKKTFSLKSDSSRTRILYQETIRPVKIGDGSRSSQAELAQDRGVHKNFTETYTMQDLSA